MWFKDHLNFWARHGIHNVQQQRAYPVDRDLHRFRDYMWPDGYSGKCRALCWCGWAGKPRWGERVAWADHQDHQRQEATKR